LRMLHAEPAEAVLNACIRTSAIATHEDCA
jgi:hypothetical protein